jgi:hypothetical protein
MFGLSQKAARDFSSFTSYPVHLTEPVRPVFTKVVMGVAWVGDITIGDLTFSTPLEEFVNAPHGRIPEKYITKYVDIRNARTPGVYHRVPLMTPFMHKPYDKDAFVKLVMKENKGLPTEFYEIWDGDHRNIWAVVAKNFMGAYNEA